MMRNLVIGIILLMVTGMGYATNDNCLYFLGIESTQVKGSWDLYGKSEIRVFVSTDFTEIVDVDWWARDDFELKTKRGQMRWISNNDEDYKHMILKDEHGDFKLSLKVLEVDLLFNPNDILIKKTVEMNINELNFNEVGEANLRFDNKNTTVNLAVRRFCQM